MITSAVDCPLCIDGYAPAGIDPILNALYRACPSCGRGCVDCGGTAVYPASTSCMGCFVEALAELGYIPTLCPGCDGIVHVARNAIPPERSQP